MKRPLTLTTCLWGNWHVSAFLDIMLPTAMARGNIPAVADLYDVTYRIMLDRPAYEALAGNPLLREMTKVIKVEAALVADDVQLHFNCHVDWFNQSIATARAAGTLLAFIPPDVAWSNNALGSMARALHNGAAGVAGPHFRVADETFRPAFAKLDRVRDVVDLVPGDLVRMGAEHMHPLSCAAMAGSRHGRIALEMMWRVPSEGFVLRQGCRELTALDPTRIETTQIFYAGPRTKAEDLHIVTDSDEMLMLSLHPVNRDLLLYHRNRETGGPDIAFQMINHQNDTPLNAHFASKKMRLHYGRMSDFLWRGVEMKSDLVMNEAVRIWQAYRHSFGDTGEDKPARTEDGIRDLLNEVMIDYAKGRGSRDPVPACLERWAEPQERAIA